MDIKSAIQEWETVFGPDAAAEVKAINDVFSAKINKHVEYGYSVGYVVTVGVKIDFSISNCHINEKYLSSEHKSLVQDCIIDAVKKANANFSEWYKKEYKEYEDKVFAVAEQYKKMAIENLPEKSGKLN